MSISLHICLYRTFVPGAVNGVILGPLELVLQMVVSHTIRARNSTCTLPLQEQEHLTAEPSFQTPS